MHRALVPLLLFLAAWHSTVAFTAYTAIQIFSIPPPRMYPPCFQSRRNLEGLRHFADITASTAEAVSGSFGDSDELKEAVVYDEKKTVEENPFEDSQTAVGHNAAMFSTDVVTTTGTKPKQPSFPIVLWKFTRPHTLIGSAFAIPSLHILAAPTIGAAFSAKALLAMLYALIPALLMNLYITGLNQITDIEIDKVNKPNLPIPAGMLSVRTAIVTVVVSVVTSLSMGMAHPIYSTEGLNVALWGSGILGTLYSLPPFRLKRFPVLAAFCIVAVRGAIINASFFAHSAAAAYGSVTASTFAWSSSSILYCLKTNRACLLSSLFFAVFGLTIALMKDVPDVVGDLRANVRTFSVRLGQKRVFFGMRWMLSGLFFAVGCAFFRAALTAPTWALMLCRGITACSSTWAGLSVRQQAQGVDPEDSKQAYDYYMHLWKLFYLSYFALPLVR